ncbi:HEAT repeat-containing protein 3 [Vanessa cardui]|uniref:HEAT repeat-containing protein 3 n=1 Tax=Vanessa cardui TaxID=171605 RepID=UPI001F132ECD|nr:HEAT repeat-containing protein 3 [Vanessa cardui]
MGKIRKRKANKGDIIESTPDDEELPVGSKENAIQTMIDQIQTANVEEKYCGLQTFAMLIESPGSLQQMIDRGIVKIVAPLLFDQASSIRNAAAGSLRNMSTVSLDMCDLLMEHDVMTPLICYFHEYAETWSPDVNSKTKDEDTDTMIQCTNLLLNLCESSGLAVNYVGNSRLLDIFPRYLDISTFGKEIVIDILQCLFVIVEDNPLAKEKVKLSSERQLTELLLLEDSDPTTLFIKTLAGGVIITVGGNNIDALPIDVMNQIFAVLAKTLSVDHRVACNQLSSSVPLGDAAGKVEALKGKEALQLQNQIKSVTHILESQKYAIEIIANICSCEGEAVGSTEGPDSSDSDDETADDVSSNGEESLLYEDVIPAVILEALISIDILNKVWTRTQLPPENVLMILNEYEDTQLVHKKIHSLQVRALLCMNNLLLGLPTDYLGGINGIYRFWVEAGKLAFKQNSKNLDLLEAATAAMRAALNKITNINRNKPASESNLFSDLALSDIEIMLTGIKECQVPAIRANLFRMIGILALLLINNLNETTSEVICCITEFILEQAHKENEVWVLAEAIDTLVDMYAEDETDQLAAKVQLVDKLAVLAPLLKNKTRQQKNLPKDYKALVKTANSNLPRFIKYKKSRVSML